MKFLMETLNRKDAIEKLPVIKMEIDYELLTLFDAMKAKDQVQKIKSKERLETLRKQLIEIENIH